ncbi:restriction endonuclease subunit S [Elizabethkingia anophelis]|uniref:restriction endonuclease subunit S n=1 Tax=Elizabethkingia TaxID=308865 RepID=UPI0021A6A3A5|nr:restriction endonuclease subunit S [Elizabethkingia sp. HX YK]MCT3651806.1 restriction endonuclease subunit S [Elizabethkingia anophelis]MCT3659151.1 restriction endonuclease subunit S [Elizabethkingia anophelis]MCT3709315.1 restriction endonuclease subunit S [Elizabethkingia anophelis]MCT4115439.1 restriction endonuclease subunit S [Elizabethkingia anophelis]MCT4201053.1 restriction endonuclease subunit S [Elizabethkingia anophelis]
MTEENKNVKKFPNLRFPGFEDEWEEKKLGEIATFSKGKGISKNEIVDNGETECIRYGELYTFYEEVISEIQSKTNTDISSLVLSEANDVIIPASGETQIDIATASCVLKSGVALGGDLNIIKTKNNGIFLSYYLNSKKKLEIAKLSQGISVVHLYSSQLALLNLKLPQFEEQEKLANFLSLLNSRIQTQKKIIEQLETLMKGNLEKIFRQKLRFKNKQGNYFSIWKTMKLDEICDIKKGEQLNKDDLTESGNYPCLNGGMSFSGYTDKFNSDENTITISEGGNSCGFVNFMKSKFWLGGHCYKIILKKDISKDFLFHLLKFYEREIMNLRVGSGLPNIQQKDLKNLQLLISEDIEEQNKIANFLSFIQEKIETEKQILEKLELQKKFLLGNLFV